MAGGRRPASYVSGMRHHTAHERSPTTLPDGTALPLWIPSIWQAAKPVTAGEASEREDGASNALATALDSAVQAAVIRALGAAGRGAQTAAPPADAAGSDVSGEEDGAVTRDSVAAQTPPSAGDVYAMVVGLQERLAKRDEQVDALTGHLERLTSRLDNVEKQGDAREKKLRADVIAVEQRARAEADMMARKHAAQFASLRDQLKSSQKAASQGRTAREKSDAESRRLRVLANELSQQLDQLCSTLPTQVEALGGRLRDLESTAERTTQESASEKDREHTTAAVQADQMNLKKSVESAIDSVSSVRSRVKRIESQLTELAKHTEESIALNSGMEDGLRGKVDELGGAVQSLKKLMEANLRTHSSAESIVKDQVSLITKHVCVAMRQYTSRRISENNELIHKTLAARIPEYAKNNDQFVLVREGDDDGHETVNIKRDEKRVD